MRGTFIRGVVVGSVTAVLTVSASAALAGTGVGGIFNLGQSNTVNAGSSLSGSTGGSELTVSNASTSGRGLSVNGAGGVAALLAHNSNGPAGAFQTPASASPFLVNSTHKVTSLNADLLDGLDSSALQKRVSGTCASGSAISSVATDGNVTCQSTGANGNGYEVVTTQVNPSGTLLGGEADCPTGKVPVGGGASMFGVINIVTADGTGPHLWQSFPTTHGWRADFEASATYSGQYGIIVQVVCVNG